MDRVETVIVGAGLSGLACASTLEKHKKEYWHSPLKSKVPLSRELLYICILGHENIEPLYLDVYVSKSIEIYRY